MIRVWRSMFILMISFLLLSACVIAPTAGGSPQGESKAVTDAEPGVVELEVVGWGAGQAQVYERMSEEHPNIRVAERMMEFGELIPFLKTRFLANEAPDIVQLQPGAMVREFHENLLPLDEYLDTDSSIDLQKFVQPVLQTAYVDGKLYAIPQHPMVSGLVWYNQDIFDELDLQVPTNYEELKNVAQACRAAEYLPLALNGKDGWNRLIVTEQFFAYAAPDKMEQAVAGQTPWTDPQLIVAMGYWKQFVDDGIFQDGVFGAGFADALGAFQEGKACMAVAGSWYKGSALSGIRPPETKGNILPMAFPDITNSGREWTPAISAGHVFAIASGTKSPEDAWAVMRSIIEYGDPLANYPVLVPVYASGIESQALQKADDPEQLQAVTAFELDAWQKKTLLDEWWYPEVRDAIAEAAVGIGTGQVSPEEAMQQVQTIADRVLSQQ